MRSAFILLALLNGLALNANAQSTSNVLADLPQQMREDIARICLPVQYQSGAEAYRSCIQDQIVSREQGPLADSVDSAVSTLTFDERYAIQQACGVDSTDSNVRACMASQVSQINALPVPRLDALSSDEQYVMQQTCFPAQSQQGAAAYRRCQLDAISSINDIPTPNYAALNAVDRNTLQLQCSARNSELANYRRCVLDSTGTGSRLAANNSPSVQIVADATGIEERSISVAPAVRIQTNTPANNQVTIQTNNNLIADEPSDTTLDANTVRRPTSIRPRLITPPRDTSTVAEAPQPITESALEPELAAALPANDTLTATDTKDVESVLDTTPQAQTANDTGNEPSSDSLSSDATSTNSNTSDTGAENNLQDRFETFKNSTLDAFANLSSQGKLLLAAIIAMPLALWAILAGRNRRNDLGNQYDQAHSRQDLKSLVRAGADDDDMELDLENDPISAGWAAEADSLFDEPPTIKIEPRKAPTPSDSEMAATEYEDTRRVEAHERPIDPQSQATNATLTPREHQPGFAGWLHTVPREEQFSLAIEFLIYWLAYGDERYEPAMKVEVFQKPDPNNHDIVKRWVLKEDVHAFADVIDWVQRNTTQIQKEQIVRFLMAVLVNGDRPTPVQNTLLRFLSDAFYLADPTLEELFEMDFGAPLPQTPRVDRMAWWDKQDPDAIASWDARALNAGDKLTRHAAQLGIDSDSSAELIELAFHRALERCNPDHFEHLGEREHQLLSGRLARLTQSHDELMEALA